MHEMSELFANFEINRQPRWPILLRLLVASLLLHASLAATVVYVPTLRDAVSLAFLAGKTEYVNKPYKKTVIGEDVQIVRLNEKFSYPAGYFAPNNVAVAASAPTPDPFAPKIISQWERPKPLTSPTPTPLPSPSPGAGVTAANANSKPAAQADDSDDETLGVKDDEINTRPLKDWLARANVLKEKGQLDLSATLEMTIDARLSPECKLVDAKVTQKSGDPQMIELAKELASAISDSRMLLFLKDPEKLQQAQDKKLDCDPMALRFVVKLDQNNFNASVETEAASPDRAATLARLYNFSLALGEVKKRGHDEEAIFKNTKVTSTGKQIIVHFNMPRQSAGELLKKQVEPKPAS
jgi:hypothetical protein